ncbi:MAG: hypothetical protein U0169_26560 [Polyangiaceae bacterium]
MLDARRERGIRAVVLGLGVGLAGAGWGAPSAADEGRTFVELDGVPAGTVARVTGGIVRRDATASAPGMPFPKKSGGAPRIEPVVFRMAPTLSPALFGWLQGAMTAGNAPKNGVTTIFGKDGTERARVAFTALRVSEVAFPALDVASKEPVFLTVTGVPDSVSTTRGNGEEGATVEDRRRRRRRQARRSRR